MTRLRHETGMQLIALIAIVFAAVQWGGRDLRFGLALALVALIAFLAGRCSIPWAWRRRLPLSGPKFVPGDEVLVDQGPRGVCTVKWVMPGLIPKVGKDLTIGSRRGYIYEVEAVEGERHQTPEYNLEPV